jgi:hypothetical protein
MWILGGNKKLETEALQKEAVDYFEKNFTPLLDSSNKNEINKDEIIKKYIDMRVKGFSKPEDNNSALRYIPKIVGIGLGINSLGIEILSDLEQLKIKKIERDITEIEKNSNKYIELNITEKKDKIKETLGEALLKSLLEVGFEEKIKLTLRKEFYQLKENNALNQAHCQREASKISIPIDGMPIFKKEAEEYFDKELKNLFLLDGTLNEVSAEYINLKNQIISNYIMMRLDGYYIDIDSFFPNIHKNKINQLINEAIDKTVENDYDSIVKEKANEFEKLYGERWNSINTDLKLHDYIKNRVGASIKIDAYRSMQAKNYNSNYCKHKITALKKEKQVYGGVSELEEEIKLYIVLYEKLNKIKDDFNKKNSGKGLNSLAYVSPFDAMSIDEKFSSIHELLKHKKDKAEFDKACSELLFSKEDFSEYDKKYISIKDRKAIKKTIKLESTWISSFTQIPENLEEMAHELQIWIEWLNTYNKQLSAIYRLLGGKLFNFLLEKVFRPYLGFWNSFINNFIYPWWTLVSKIFKKEDNLFFKILKAVSASISILVTFGGLLALSIFMPPLIPLTFVAAAWLLPKSGIWAGQGIDFLHERYDLFKYGYRDRAHFAVNGDLANLLKKSESLEGLDGIAELGPKIGKELELCQNNIDRVKKAIAQNPEGSPKDLSWIGGPVSDKVSELAKTKNEVEKTSVDGKQVTVTKWNPVKLVAKWATWFLPNSPDAAGKQILSYTEVFMGVSPERQKMINEANQLKIELDRLEKTKVILNNAWDKMTTKGEDESDDDYAKRIVGISKDVNAYITRLYIHNDNVKFTTKGLNASGIGSFHEGFEKFDVSKSKEAHEHGLLQKENKTLIISANLDSIEKPKKEAKFTSHHKKQQKTNKPENG